MQVTKTVQIGSMSMVCQHCSAKKWPGEAKGLCCSGGKVRLPLIQEPPEPLLHLLTKDDVPAKHFRRNIERYNAAFAMTSFGADKDKTDRGFFTTYKIQGQCYHLIGSLMPLHREDQKFVQVYFMNNVSEEAKQRQSNISKELKMDIILGLQELLHEHHSYVKVFKYALERLNSEEEFKVVIRPDKKPSGEHERRFNAPVTDEVAVILVGEEHGSRDIVLSLRSGQLKRIAETHRAYDSLQYPLIFWGGQDGYNFALRQVDPTTGQEKTKSVSCKDFYAYHFMIRDGFNHLHRFGRLTCQLMVDMFAKIEAERLCFIKKNQSKLRAEQYVHLRDALTHDGMDPRNIGQPVILPSSHTGSPRYMAERTQDAMSFVRSSADLISL